MRSWRRNPDSGLEAELRANRPEPSPELVDRLEMRVRTHGRGSRAGSFRVAFAGALAVGLLAALGSVGGIGYAATGASQAVQTAKRVGHAHAVVTLHKSASQDQYKRPKPKPKPKCRKGTRRVKGVCRRVKKARGASFKKPPFTG
ncbi:MAG TPA: hypothetical protein VGJ40_07605 [Gaiellaceae bacterium]|jgi:hypothetical protein